MIVAQDSRARWWRLRFALAGVVDCVYRVELPDGMLTLKEARDLVGPRLAADYPAGLPPGTFERTPECGGTLAERATVVREEPAP